MGSPSLHPDACTPKQIRRLLQLTPPTSVLMVEGPPGTGKSEVIEDYARAEGMRLLRLPLHQMEASDFLGLPSFSGTFSTFVEPRWLWELTEAAAETGGASDEAGGDSARCEPSHPSGGVLVFLDELPQATPQVMHAVSSLVLDRTVGIAGLPLAQGVRFVAAGNRVSDGAYAAPLGTHLLSRLIKVSIRVSLEDWREYARARGLDRRVIAFLSANRRWLHVFDPDRRDEPFPCPRSWATTSEILHRTRADGEDSLHEAAPLVAGTVGSAAAVEFFSFLEAAELCPSAEQVVVDPEGVALPTNRPDLALLVVENLVMACREDWARFTEGTLRFATRLPGELRAVLMTALLKEEGPADMKERILTSPHYLSLSEAIARSHQATMTFDRMIDA